MREGHVSDSVFGSVLVVGIVEAEAAVVAAVARYRDTAEMIASRGSAAVGPAVSHSCVVAASLGHVVPDFVRTIAGQMSCDLTNIAWNSSFHAAGPVECFKVRVCSG